MEQLESMLDIRCANRDGAVTSISRLLRGRYFMGAASLIAVFLGGSRSTEPSSASRSLDVSFK